MQLFLIIGRIENSDNEYTTALLAAEDEGEAINMFESNLTVDMDAEERADAKFEYDVRVLVGTYSAPGTLDIPTGCDWHLAGVQGLPQ